jgi:RNA polymerase sigma-70 factor (ECF subfamily)
MVRLHRALANVRVESVRHFFNLATVQIRRELLDLAKHYFGPEGHGANHHTDHIPTDDAGGTIYDRAGRPSEIVNLLFYEGLTHEEASRVLDTSVRTLKRRWASVKLKLHEVLNLDGQR